MKNAYRVSTDQYGNMIQKLNILQARCDSALSCSNMWKTNYPLGCLTVIPQNDNCRKVATEFIRRNLHIHIGEDDIESAYTIFQLDLEQNKRLGVTVRPL